MNFALKTGSTLSAIATFTAVATMATSPANALTFTVEGPGVLSSLQPGVTTIDFTGGAPANYTGTFITPGASIPTATAPIAGNQFISTENDPATSAANFQASFAAGLSYFGLYWGTIDTYNTISFLTNTGVESFTGTEIANAAGVFGPITGAGNFNIDRFVNFSADPGQVITGITFSSTFAAFESDNHAYRAIPTPALLPGLVALGIGMVRKRNAEASVESEA